MAKAGKSMKKPSSTAIRIKAKSKSQHAGRRGVKVQGGHTKAKFKVLFDGKTEPVLVLKSLVYHEAKKQEKIVEPHSNEQEDRPLDGDGVNGGEDDHTPWDYVAEINQYFGGEDVKDIDDDEEENVAPAETEWTCTCGTSNPITFSKVNACVNCNSHRGWGGCFGHLARTWTCQTCTQPMPMGESECTYCSATAAQN